MYTSVSLNAIKQSVLHCFIALSVLLQKALVMASGEH